LQLPGNPSTRPNPNPQCFVGIFHAPQIIECGFWHDMLNAIFADNNGVQCHVIPLMIEKIASQKAALKAIASKNPPARVTEARLQKETGSSFHRPQPRQRRGDWRRANQRWRVAGCSDDRKWQWLL
jgi:hypothetical protein